MVYFGPQSGRPLLGGSNAGPCLPLRGVGRPHTQKKVWFANVWQTLYVIPRYIGEEIYEGENC